MKVNRVRELFLEEEIRDASFLDDDNFALITPSANLLRASFTSGADELIFSGRDILKPVAKALGTRRHVDAAGGDYPRLATSHHSEWVIVNTHDLVLVACRKKPDFKLGLFSYWRTRIETRLLAFTWGLYYPALHFSPDGSWLAVEHNGSSLIFDMHNFACRELEISVPFAWHPHQPRLLGFDGNGRMVWMDITQSSPSPEILFDLGYDSVSRNVVGVWIHPSGESCLTFSPKGDWMWCELTPFQLRSQGRACNEKCMKVYGRPGVSWMAAQSLDSIWIGELHDDQISWIELPSTIEAKFSPSGGRLITLSQIPTNNPHPAHPIIATKRTATLWEIEDVWDL